jgi:hypothetical protein
MSMYVDSGADITLVPRRFGKLLGLDLQKNKHFLAGLTGKPIAASTHIVRLKIGERKADATVAVASRENVPYILGRAGVFPEYKITFEEYNLITNFATPRKQTR